MKKTYNYWRYAVMANKKVNKFANTNTVKTTENKSAETVVAAAAPVEAKAAAPEVKAPVEAKAEVKAEAAKEEKKPASKKAPAKKEEAPAEKAVKKAAEKDAAKLFIEFLLMRSLKSARLLTRLTTPESRFAPSKFMLSPRTTRLTMLLTARLTVCISTSDTAKT